MEHFPRSATSPDIAITGVSKNTLETDSKNSGFHRPAAISLTANDEQGRLFPDPPLGISGPMARRDDPDTSHAAADAFTEKRLSDIQADVLAWFRIVKRATDEELEMHFREKYLAQTTVSKRRTDLVRLGYLRDSGDRKHNSNLRKMIIWELVQE